MVALIKIETDKPTGWIIANTIAELKICLTGNLFFNDEQKKSMRDLASILPPDSDEDFVRRQYNGYWLIRS